MNAIQPAVTQENRRLQIFLCHSSGDKPRVRDLYQRLKRDGFEPWLDEEDLVAGQKWQEEIPKAVRACEAVLVCLSRSSITREGYVQKEIKIALDVADEKPAGTIFMIPVRLEDVEVPERLREWHWVNLFAENGYERLLRALQIRARELGIVVTASVQRQVPANAGMGVAASELARAPGTVQTSSKDGQRYVWIPPGTFQMGCSPGDSECFNDERPAHRVTISKGLWLGQTPVTQAAYRRVMGDNPSHFQGDNLPVETVTWKQARAYCEKVGGRLPTEAEWEYAARAGSDAARYGDLGAIGWYDKNSEGRTHEVGQKQANQWGLYDMLGNVWEWVGDWYDDKYYAQSPSVDPAGPASGTYRVVRGGSWIFVSRDLRSSFRGRYGPDVRFNGIGFRCAREVDP